RLLIRRRRRCGEVGPALRLRRPGRGPRRHDVAAALRREKLRDVGRTWYAGTRPLRMISSIRVRIVRASGREDELPLQPFHRPWPLRNGAVQIRMLRRAAVSRAIDDIDLVAFG